MQTERCGGRARCNAFDVVVLIDDGLEVDFPIFQVLNLIEKDERFPLSVVDSRGLGAEFNNIYKVNPLILIQISSLSMKYKMFSSFNYSIATIYLSYMTNSLSFYINKLYTDIYEININ